MKPGERIGRYRIEKRLGEGGVGEVFRAVDEDLGRTVAIKRLRPELAERPLLVQRFRSEAQTLARLNHPNIATLYSFEYEPVDDEPGRETPWMVMEYVDGETVASLLRSRGHLELGPALQLFFQALDGIGYAHQCGVIHRDLKGSNLMLSSDGTLKIMDFGIARVLGGERVTRGGQLVGTPEFMAPEQVRGEDVDERSDLYALATLLFSLLTGRAPFTATSEYDLMRAQVESPPPSLCEACPELPGALDLVLHQALAKNADDRHGSAAELRAALEPFAPPGPEGAKLVWPVRAPRFGETPSEPMAICSMADGTSWNQADVDAPTLVGPARPSAQALPLIEAELIAESEGAAQPQPEDRRLAATPTKHRILLPRGRARWTPPLLLAGFALVSLATLDAVTLRSDADLHGDPPVASPPRAELRARNADARSTAIAIHDPHLAANAPSDAAGAALHEAPQMAAKEGGSTELAAAAGVAHDAPAAQLDPRPGRDTKRERSDTVEPARDRRTASAPPGGGAALQQRHRKPEAGANQGDNQWVIRR